MEYSIAVDSYFSAAHSLKGYKGKCENIHGHNWKVSVVIAAGTLDKTGMVFDFKKAKTSLDGVLVLLDHRQLDKMPFFKKRNPTSELIAEFIFNSYKKKIKPPLRLKNVTVWETPNSSATFYGD